MPTRSRRSFTGTTRAGSLSISCRHRHAGFCMTQQPPCETPRQMFHVIRTWAAPLLAKPACLRPSGGGHSDVQTISILGCCLPIVTERLKSDGEQATFKHHALVKEPPQSSVPGGKSQPAGNHPICLKIA
jgi:hypothetical protein